MTVSVVNVRTDTCDVYIGRPSKWGNPFVIGRDGNRTEVIDKYQEWLLSQPELVEEARAELPDMVLGCYCKPEACHGDILAWVVDEAVP